VTLPLAAIMSTSKRDAKPGNKLNHLYSSFEIPKKNGKKRTITAPSPILKKVQKSVLTNLINGVRVHPAANGFRLGKSIITNAFPHTNKKILANCDVANCFPSISWPLIYKALKNSLENHVGIEAVSILTDICSKEGSLPMGAPTSPALLNIVLYKTDEVLFKAASNLNCSYTRYADDLTFSGDDKAIKLIGLAGVSLNKIGLKIDPVKTNIFRRGRRQSVTGLVVNDGISVNRKYRKSVRAAAHRIEHDQEPTWHGKPVTKSSIQGRIDFINSVHKKTNAKKD
jgi:retron-type reverse transcriptase